MCVAISGTKESINEQTGLVNAHAYAVLQYARVRKLQIVCAVGANFSLVDVSFCDKFHHAFINCRFASSNTAQAVRRSVSQFKLFHMVNNV